MAYCTIIQMCTYNKYLKIMEIKLFNIGQIPSIKGKKNYIKIYK